MLSLRHRLAVAFAALASIAVGNAQVADGQTPAAPYSQFALSATATGAHIDFTIDQLLPVNQVVGFASALAEANLSTSRSTGLAALGDPGTTLRDLPGTADGFANTDLPDYPNVVRAEFPLEPEATAGEGPAVISATAAADRASAHAAGTATGDAPVLIGGSEALSEARIEGDALVATATSHLYDIAFAGAPLVIESISSVVEIAVTADGVSVRRNEVTVQGASVGGTPVSITSEGLVVSGLATPLPVGSVPGLPEGYGVRATQADEQLTDRGGTVTSGSVVVEVLSEVQGRPATLRIVLGGTRASATAAARAPGSGAPVRPEPAAPALAPPSPGSPPSVATAALPVPTRPESTAAPAASTAASFVGSDPWPALDFRPLFPALAAAGGALAASRRAVRRRGAVAAAGARSPIDQLWRW